MAARLQCWQRKRSNDRKLKKKKMPENKNDLDCYTEARNLWLSPRKMSNIMLSSQRSEKWRWFLKSEKQQDDSPRWLRKFVFLILHTSALYCTDAVKTPRTDTSAFTLAQHILGENCTERCNVYKILHAFELRQEDGLVCRYSHTRRMAPCSDLTEFV